MRPAPLPPLPQPFPEAVSGEEAVPGEAAERARAARRGRLRERGETREARATGKDVASEGALVFNRRKRCRTFFLDK